MSAGLLAALLVLPAAPAGAQTQPAEPEPDASAEQAAPEPAAERPGAEAEEQADGDAAETTDEAGNEVPPAPDDVEEFLVVAPPLQEILSASRMDADELINTLNAEELSKFAATDVADALKFVAGVNVVEGQFAVIRGLEDRYTSTLFNNAVVPSPDPDSQSPQLDLFPSEVVSNLVVSKTFSPDLPSNTSGGAVSILTNEEIEDGWQLKLNTGTGLNDNAWERFLRLDSGSAMGTEVDHDDVLERDYGGSLTGRRRILDRDVRLKAVFNHEIDYETGKGFQEGREPRRSQVRNFPRPPTTTVSGDLSLGELSLSDGRFDLTESERAEQLAGFLGLGFDIDPEGSHRIDSSLFYTKKETDVVQLRQNGYFPRLNYQALADAEARGEDISDSFYSGVATPGSWLQQVRANPEDAITRGPLWRDSFQASSSFETERDLRVYQLNGDHQVDLIEGLHFSWAGNYAKTTQTENANGAQYFFEGEQDGPIDAPVNVDDFSSGRFFVNNNIFHSFNDIRETQKFGRLDSDYEFSPHEALTIKLTGGLWYEKADRDVDSSYLEAPLVDGSSQFVISGGSKRDLGQAIQDALDRDGGDYAGTRHATNQSEREIEAWNVSAKATIFEQLDLLGGVRRESIFIQSLNDPYTGEVNPFDGAPVIFPAAYLFFDRRDNPSRPLETPTAPPGTVFNDEILGIDLPIDPVTGYVDLLTRGDIDALVNGTIDEKKLLPALGATYRPLEGLTVRAAWSKTVARPSFREMGYYVSVEPATDDLIIGNPQLQLSDVESYDLRLEYLWGDGDMIAVSGFYKTIQDPIESIVVRDPNNFGTSSNALYRTFFNNPNEGELWGVELEARKGFGFLPFELAQYVSLGGNVTYIDATVKRTEAELARSVTYFGLKEGDEERFSDLSDERRLFGQPEWTANLDLTFQHPDWGTKASLVLYAISDVLDAAGSASIDPRGVVYAYTLDRYIDSYYQLDFNVSQTVHVDLLPGEFTIKASLKNLTDSTRSIIYDSEQTHEEITERSLRIGRDYSLSLQYTIPF